MYLYNSDVDASDHATSPAEEGQDDDDATPVTPSFFELRQRALLGMEQGSAFMVVALGLLRKLRSSTKSPLSYAEIEDGLGRYFRILDADSERFATLYEVLKSAAAKHVEEQLPEFLGSPCKETAAQVAEEAAAMLSDGMQEIAVVLLACSKMQRRSLDLKMAAQRSLAESDDDQPALISFSRFGKFFEEALDVYDQLKRKHEELQQRRLKAMARVMDAKAAVAAASSASSQ